MARSSSNPAFSRNPAFSTGATKGFQVANAPTAEQLDEMYGRPSATAADTERMTYENTITKIVISFVVLLAGAALGWVVPVLAIPAAIAAFVLSLVLIFKKKPSAPLTLAYAALEGVFVGGISVIFENLADGAVSQAVIATLVIVGVVLVLFRSGKIRASKRATKVFLIAMIGYAVFSLINMGLVLFGANTDPWGLRGGDFFGIPIALLLGVLVVILASYSLVLDFDSIQQGVRQGAPAAFGWTAAFGVMVTVVWLYLELLRMIAILRGGE
ncbi:Bax inhibitor-1/YccA family protein [Microcella daejeonensis]|uniref:Bax inhibitor-1/YccA family protein n=1 Tax=Microcella daejeonensis TaxID=2994971 RepID=A0A9E8S8C2_9MICO|nr:Bax inhibitor-1/YccA family protein [Microcella daejeonensis]WAB80301.1 Bax inhibitor-1/YccA family protein [Microcella daejeonensis]WAB84886.1 Bax inhibitor-1/YccA family protein [Microcella daejeonensis]